jgi:hypothetical protein
MNPNRNLFEVYSFFAKCMELCWLMERLDEADSRTRNEVKILQRWLVQEFRRLLRGGTRWEAEQKFLGGVDRLRHKTFNRIVKTRVLRAKIHADAARLGLAPNAAKVDEAGIREETLTEFKNALRGFSANTSPA